MSHRWHVARFPDVPFFGHSGNDVSFTNVFRRLTTVWFLVLLAGCSTLFAAPEPPEERLIKALVEIARPLSESRPRFGYRLQAGTSAWSPFNEPRIAEIASDADRKAIPHTLLVERFGEQDWSIHLQSSWKEVKILRSAGETTIFLPRQRVALVGRGNPPPEDDSLEPRGLMTRMFTPETMLFGVMALLEPAIFEAGTRNLVLPHLQPVPVSTATLAGTASPASTTNVTRAVSAMSAASGTAEAASVTSATSGTVDATSVTSTSSAASAVTETAGGGNTSPATPESAREDAREATLQSPPPAQPEEFRWRIPGGHTLRLAATEPARLRLELASGSGDLAGLKYVELALEASLSVPVPVASGDFIVTEVPRNDLEKTIFRGLRKILSLKLPGPAIREPPAPKRVPHGELRLKDGQLLVLLSGTPTEIGTAHGQLLAPLIERTVDSTLYLVGLVETLEKGTWFQKDLEEAWTRVSPFIPASQIEEIAALASACPRLSWREMRLANIFPEYFHCSGFALFGRATKGGELYHGRVLDYMTEIGLQHAAVTFVVKPARGHGFMNVGYAGFTGSVTGMNERQVSLGEMGGGGRYQWDGMPMAAMMRHALETCGTLDEVKRFWAGSPRTCEYYYVFADGKIPSAVAVQATPGELLFLAPGESHPRLGDGIPDTVVLSAGRRLAHLRQRVLDGHGTFDATGAIRLMDRPVAMRSNLHNALFIPRSLQAWIAHADDGKPAAERPYVRYELEPLLKEATALP